MWAVVFCLAALSATVLSTGYVPGHQYVYDYEANIYSELKEQHHQHSGFFFKSKVYVQPVDGAFYFRIDDFVYDKVNTRVNGLDSYNYKYREHTDVSKLLEKPFKAYMENGLVTRLKFSRDETEFSINLKKGVASLFQLNFDQVHAIRTEHGQNLLNPDHAASYYRVMEGGLIGECEMMYEITEDHSHFEHTLNVTKSRNYQNCVTQAYQFYHSYHFDQCADCERVNHPIHLSDVYRYDIRGDRHNYMIDRVDAEGEFFYSPYTFNGEKPYTHVNRSLVFAYEKTSGEEIKLSSDAVTHHGLEYEGKKKFDFRELVDLKKAHYLHDIMHKDINMEEIGKLFVDLLEDPQDREFTNTFKDKHKPLHFVELLEHFAAASYDEIHTFYTQYISIKENGDFEKYSHLFFDVLSATGTNPSIMYAKYLISKHSVHSGLVAHFLATLPQSIKETHEILLDELYRLCETDISRNYPHLKNNCYLSLSSVVYENCVSNYYVETTKFPSNAKSICSPKDAEKYFDYIVRDYSQVETNSERLANIKVAGNFGIRKSVDYLQEYIVHSDRYPTYFRVSAVFSLRRALHYYPEVIKNVLFPIYFNQSEPHELRISTFINILMTNPPLNQLDAIGLSLAHEPSSQVLSYVYSFFYHLAHSDYPCLQEIKKNSQVVLRHIDRLNFKFEYDLRKSFTYFSNGYSEKYDFGGATTLSYVTSNDSYIPSLAYLGLSDYFGGKSFDTLSVAYHGYGLDKFFDKMFGPEGIYKKKSSIFDIFRRRTARDAGKASVEKELKEIDERLHIQTREYEPIQGDISLRVFGNEISFLYFDEKFFEDFLTEGTFGIGNAFNPLNIPNLTAKRYVIARNTLLVMPLDIGLPVFLSYKEPVFYTIKNIETKFQVSPSMFSDDRNSEAPASIDFNINAHLVYDHVVQATSGIILQFEGSKIGVGRTKREYSSAPMKFNFHYDTKTHQAAFKLTPVLDLTIIHKSSKPYTFIDYYNNHVPNSLEDTVMPYYKPEEMKSNKFDIGHDYLGYGLHVDVQHGKLKHFSSKGAYNKFYTENDFRSRFYYFVMDPHMSSYNIDVQVTPASLNVLPEIELTLNFDFIGAGVRDNKVYVSDVYKHEDGFEDHLKAYPGRKFYTYIMKGELLVKGTDERKAVLEITHTHSCDHQYRKTNLYFDRTPFGHDETDHFKVCLTSNLRYPQYDLKKLYNLDTLELAQQVNFGMSLKFGKDCTTDKKITVHGVMKRSEEQIAMENQREVVDHIHYNPYAHYYAKCMEDRQHNQYYSINCRKYIYQATKMNHYSYNMEFEGEMTPEFMNATAKLKDYVDHALYYYMDHQRFGINNEAGKSHMEAIFSVNGNVVDVLLEQPHERTIYEKVPVPRYMAPLSASPWLGFTNLKKFNKFFLKPTCSVEGDIINTYDNVTYTLPNIDCWKVISKDCSEHEYFTLLGKKIKHSRYTKAVKVFLGKYKVEALPVTEESGIIIRVNGKKIAVTDLEPYFQLVGEKDKEREIFRVVYNGLYYTIVSDYYGVKVYYDGKAIISEITPYYRGKQCGLCGDFNNERHKEFRGPENCVYHDVTEFSYSYSIPDETCDVPDIKNPCERETTRPCILKRNRYIYVGTRQRQMCFTTIPLTECSKDCAEGKKVTKNVGFYCLNAKDYFTRFLQRESRDRVLHEVKGKPENHFAELEVPEECVPREV